MALSPIGFAGLLSAIIVMLTLTFYAFHLREHHPAQYTGFWRFLGNITQTPIRAVASAAGLLFGALIANGILLLLRPTEKQSLTLYIDAILVLLLFLTVVFGISLYRVQKRE